MNYRRPYVIRASSAGAPYKSVSIPKDCSLLIGQKVRLISNDFVLVIPEDMEINESALENLVKK